MGVGFPFTSYIDNYVDREFRVSPSPGYYPVLKELDNSLGSIHINASFLINLELGFLQQLEIQFAASRFLWSRATTTYVSCKPVSVYNNSFDDAATEYYPVDGAPCVKPDAYEPMDISDDGLDSLWFLNLSVGGRYHFYQTLSWNIFLGAHLGASLAIFDKNYWGGELDALIGFNYRISPLFLIEFGIELKFMLTEAPESRQARINHETQTQGNVFTSLVEPYLFLDFLLSLRFDLSNI